MQEILLLLLLFYDFTRLEKRIRNKGRQRRSWFTNAAEHARKRITTLKNGERVLIQARMHLFIYLIMDGMEET